MRVKSGQKIQGRFVDIPLVAGSDETGELTGNAIASKASAYMDKDII